MDNGGWTNILVAEEAAVAVPGVRSGDSRGVAYFTLTEPTRLVIGGAGGGHPPAPLCGAGGAACCAGGAPCPLAPCPLLVIQNCLVSEKNGFV